MRSPKVTELILHNYSKVFHLIIHRLKWQKWSFENTHCDLNDKIISKHHEAYVRTLVNMCKVNIQRTRLEYETHNCYISQIFQAHVRWIILMYPQYCSEILLLKAAHFIVGLSLCRSLVCEIYAHVVKSVLCGHEMRLPELCCSQNLQLSTVSNVNYKIHNILL